MLLVSEVGNLSSLVCFVVFSESLVVYCLLCVVCRLVLVFCYSFALIFACCGLLQFNYVVDIRCVARTSG